MIFLTRRAALMAVAVVLTACASRPMNQLGGVQPQGSAFDSALTQDYLGLSQSEKAQGDHRDADTYAQRAVAASGGQATEPDQLELRNPFLKSKYTAELSEARQRLVSALDRSGRDKAPGDAARAQSAFDCWLEQASEDLQQDHIDACKQAYLDAIAKVEAALAEAPPPEVAAPENYLVFFDYDKADVTPEGAGIIESAAADANGAPFKRIVATGHTDTAGPASYNMELSQRRADAVKSALEGFGADTSTIDTVAEGETDPLVPTDDGVPEPQNRRVEIVIER